MCHRPAHFGDTPDASRALRLPFPPSTGPCCIPHTSYISFLSLLLFPLPEKRAAPTNGLAPCQGPECLKPLVPTRHPPLHGTMVPGCCCTSQMRVCFSRADEKRRLSNETRSSEGWIGSAQQHVLAVSHRTRRWIGSWPISKPVVAAAKAAHGKEHGTCQVAPAR